MSGFLSWMKSNIVIVLLGDSDRRAVAGCVVLLERNERGRCARTGKSEAQKALRDVTSAKVTYSLPPMLTDGCSDRDQHAHPTR